MSTMKTKNIGSSHYYVKRLASRISLMLLFLIGFTSFLKAQQIKGDSAVCVSETTTYTFSEVIEPDDEWVVTNGTVVSTSDDNTELSVKWSSFPGFGFISILRNGQEIASFSPQILENPRPIVTPLLEIQCKLSSFSLGEVFSEENNCQKVCENSAISYTTVYNVGSTYTWNVTGAQNYTINQNQLSVIWGAAGTGSISVTETNASGCSETAILCVEIKQAPSALYATVPALNGNVLNICLGQEVYFQDLSTNAFSWNWEFGDGEISSTQNPSHQYNQPGTYQVTLTVYNGIDPADFDPRQFFEGFFGFDADIPCYCSSTYTITVVVDALSAPQIDCISVLCGNETQTYSTTAPCANYTWSVQGGTIASTDENTVTVNWGDGAAGPGLLTLDVGNCQGYCTQPTTVAIPLIPTSAQISGDPVVCFGGITEYYVPLIPGTSYNWSVSGGIVVSGQNTNKIQVVWIGFGLDLGTYRVKVAYENIALGCSGEAEMNVQILPKLDIYTSFNTKICTGQSYDPNTLVLSSLYDDSEVLGNWDVITPNGAYLSNVQTNSARLTDYLFGDGLGTYTIIARSVQDIYCNKEVYATLQVIAPPAAPELIQGLTEICPGNTYSYTAQPSAASFAWTVNGGQIENSTTNPVNVTWNSEEPYELSVVAYNEYGCYSEPKILTVKSRLPFEMPQLSSTAETCPGGNTTVMASALIPDASYSWSLDQPELGEISPSSDGKQLTIKWSSTVLTSTIVQVQLQVTLCGVSQTVSLPVEIKGFNSQVSIPLVACVGVPVEFSAETDGTIEWLFGDGNNSLQAQAEHTYAVAQTYVIQVAITQSSGCEAVYSQLLEVKSSPKAGITSADKRLYCPGEEIDIQLESMSVSDMPLTVQWYKEGFPDIFVGNTTPVTVNELGNYYALITDTNGCTSVSDSILFYEISCTPCTVETGSADFTYESGAVSCTQVHMLPQLSANYRVLNWKHIDNEGQFVLLTEENDPMLTFNKAGYHWLRMVYRGPNALGQPGDSVDCFVDHYVFLPIAADFYSQPLCIDNEYNVRLVDASSYFGTQLIDYFNWTENGITLSNAQYPLLNLSAGTHLIGLEVKVTATGATCFAEKEVFFPTEPVADFVADASQCAGGELLLTDNSTGDLFRFWYNFSTGEPAVEGNYALQTRISSTVINTPGVRDIELRVRDNFGCESTKTLTIDIQGAENNSITVEGTSPFCPGGSVSLTAPEGGDYLWSTGETTPQIEVFTQGTYSVELTGINGCRYTTNPVSVEQYLVSKPEISGEQSYCSNERVELETQSGFTSYTWTVEEAPEDNQNVFELNGFSQLTQFYNNLGMQQNGNYIVRVNTTDEHGCISNSEPFLVTMNAAPDMPIIVLQLSPDEINFPCEGSSSTLYVESPQANVTYYWSTGETGTSIVVNQKGDYSVKAVSDAGCSTESEFPFTIHPLPDISKVMTGCYEFCENEKPFVPVIGSLSDFNSFYNLYKKVQNEWLLVASGFPVEIDESGTYQVQIINVQTVCFAYSDEISVTFNPLPEIFIEAETSELCSGSSTELTVRNIDNVQWYENLEIPNCSIAENGQAVYDFFTALKTNGQLVYDQELVLTATDYQQPIAVLSDNVSFGSQYYGYLYNWGSGISFDLYDESQYQNGFVIIELDKSALDPGFSLNDVANFQSVIPIGDAYTFVLQAQLMDNTLVNIPGSVSYYIRNPLGFGYVENPMPVANCTNLSLIGEGNTITVQPDQTTTYTVSTTDSETGCSNTKSITVQVNPILYSATIDCCEDKSICKGMSASIPVSFTGTGPWTFTYFNGEINTTVTTSNNPYNIMVSPLATTTYSLVSVSGQENACTEVCGKATVAVNSCTAVVQPKKGKKIQDCSKNCFSTTVLSVIDKAPGCKTVTLRVSCNNTCEAALSHFTVSVPCGTISSMSNTLGFPITKVSKDPTTGLGGIKVDNIQDFCEEKTAESFEVTYTVCSNEATCGNGDFCPPLVAYKAGTCVNYGITTNPSNFKSLDEEEAPGAGIANIQVFPNPFNDQTSIVIDLSSDSQTELGVYDLNGKLISELHTGKMLAGTSVFIWDGTNMEGAELPDGLYYVKSKINDTYSYIKLMHIR